MACIIAVIRIRRHVRRRPVSSSHFRCWPTSHQRDNNVRAVSVVIEPNDEFQKCGKEKKVRHVVRDFSFAPLLVGSLRFQYSHVPRYICAHYNSHYSFWSHMQSRLEFAKFHTTLRRRMVRTFSLTYAWLPNISHLSSRTVLHNSIAYRTITITISIIDTNGIDVDIRAE